MHFNKLKKFPIYYLKIMIKFFNYLFIEESAEFIGPGLFVLNKRKLFKIF